jgi:hypothetical protein
MPGRLIQGIARNLERRRDPPFGQNRASRVRARPRSGSFRVPRVFPTTSGKKGPMMNSSRTTYASLLRPLNVTRAALALLLLALVAPVKASPDDDDHFPDLGTCQNLQVPAGNEVVLHVLGVGVQIYTWTGTSWSFVSPEAVLFADPRDQRIVGFHFAGPSWESFSGSKVVGATIQSCTPNPDAIPWLLLGAVSNEGHGIFRHVTFIQRLNTVGGIAPTVPGDFPGQVARVPYSARYFLYQAEH